MRQLRWLATALGIALTGATSPAWSATETEPRSLGNGPAYEILAKLAVLHEGRIKPLDTLAREEVRQIYGRETVKLIDANDPKEPNRIVESWSPVAALFDWSVRPEFWDDQPIILVEYLPLKRLILAETIQARLNGTAGKEGTTPADRDALKALAADSRISTEAIHEFLSRSTLPAEDQAALKALAATLAESHKWLTPRQLEEAKITEGEGHEHEFNEWFAEVVGKKRKADASMTGEGKLNEVEKRGYEVGTRLVHYQAIRDRSMRSVEPLMVMPRPSNKEYLAFLAKTYEKAQKLRSIEGLSPLELDGAKALNTYWNELSTEERTIPGTDPKFDEKFASWLRGSSAWVPLRALLDSKPEDLTTAGYPAEKISAFFTTFKALTDAEVAAPGQLEPARAESFVIAARSLGESVNSTGYPTVAAIDRETYFNESNPFWKAQWVYMLATALLAACVGFMSFERRSALGAIGRLLYGGGLIGLVGGIALECMGFYHRILISGWAPVTNMYETVIWVSLVAAVLGLVFEGIFRKVFAALAGSGVALLGTVLAANVPLLDPNIKQLQPVLRSNYWLTIHVLTEVSSYGAFLLAACLGLIATCYYLTATYRRSPSFTELALPMVPGLPLLAMGIVGLLASNGSFGSSWETGDSVFYLSYCFAAVGGILTLTSLGSILGEIVSRLTFRDRPATEAGSRDTVAQSEISATKSARPTVAEIREKAAANRPQFDARGQAMQATAAKIKPLSNFIYRTMQVGVLLIASGTILGGVWADYSWGRFWGWDPKEVWALITLLVYLVPLHGRFAGWFNTFSLVAASVVCSMSVIMAWYGVNFVLGVGLHSYGFVEGGGQGIVSAVCLGVLALPAAAGWRRWLGSRSVVSTSA